jgi:hypothetical protein
VISRLGKNSLFGLTDHPYRPSKNALSRNPDCCGLDPTLELTECGSSGRYVSWCKIAGPKSRLSMGSAHLGGPFKEEGKKSLMETSRSVHFATVLLDQKPSACVGGGGNRGAYRSSLKKKYLWNERSSQCSLAITDGKKVQ